MLRKFLLLSAISLNSAAAATPVTDITAYKHMIDNVQQTMSLVKEAQQQTERMSSVEGALKSTPNPLLRDIGNMKGKLQDSYDIIYNINKPGELSSGNIRDISSNIDSIFTPIGKLYESGNYEQRKNYINMSMREAVITTESIKTDVVKNYKDIEYLLSIADNAETQAEKQDVAIKFAALNAKIQNDLLFLMAQTTKVQTMMNYSGYDAAEPKNNSLFGSGNSNPFQKEEGIYTRADRKAKCTDYTRALGMCK
ncbi:MAG: hypothetical protein J0G32_03795 [Alphaproteobacteria bacterium]|jgi:hypothetical protein|nr:hypothetical protein [Alphaproteobacteria bacterium]OJV12552.1 MAG: hypothetical protein BGO27_03410 [Alphaproteobacteria bacterium 33-17]